MSSTSCAPEHRRYSRHPVCAPLICCRPGHREERQTELRNIGFGGLAFGCNCVLLRGDMVSVNFPTIRICAVGGVVRWAVSVDEGAFWRLCGVEFMESSLFVRARLVELFCGIESYRESERVKHGRVLTHEVAADEWIAHPAVHP